MLLFGILLACMPDEVGSGAGPVDGPSYDPTADTGPACVEHTGDVTPTSGICDDGGCVHVIGRLDMVGQAESDLTGLDCVRSVSGDVLLFEGDPAWRGPGLEALVTVGGSVDLYGTSPSALGLSSLRVVGASLGLHVSSIEGLGALQEVGGELLVQGGSISDLEGLDGLHSLGGLFLDRTSLQSLEGLGPITSLSGRLSLQGNEELDDISWLSNLSQVGDLSIDGSPRITSLSPLAAIGDVAEDVAIVRMDALPSLEGLAGVSHIGGRLYVANNPSLTSLSGLDSLVAVKGDVQIIDTQLASMDGLEQLTEIGSTLQIKDHRNLRDLQGLYGVTSVGRSIEIQDNTGLTDDAAWALAGRIPTPPYGVEIHGND